MVVKVYSQAKDRIEQADAATVHSECRPGDSRAAGHLPRCFPLSSD